MRYIEAIIPSEEIIEDGIRKKRTAFPMLAVREIVANALIHQDFSISGTGPTVEVFTNRIEVTNPGRSLVDAFRIIDTPPRSRNESLSALMRRMGICEELGTGWDKIAIECELQQLPAPRMDVYEESTKVILFSETRFSDISIEDRIWGCYLHACIKYIQGDYLTNSSLRSRFGLNHRYPVLITGKIDIIGQNIVRFQIIADAVQLLSCRDLPRVFRCSGASGKLHVFLCALPGRLSRFLNGLSGLLHRLSRLLDRFCRLCFLPGISSSFRRIVFGFR
ncbi:MAG: hypothetical protein IJ110_02625 [Lachnospiraceae bacterium]|nr:hypothetical protein [Lachnospiraceae bacterium]